MAIISGRYGSVQRMLPTGFDAETGQAIWSVAPTDAGFPENMVSNTWTVPAESAITGEPATSGLAGAGGGQTVSSITSWTLENTITPIPFTASNTRGYQGRLAGLHSCTGNIAGIGGIPPFAPGQRFRFLGFVGPSNGQIDNTNGTVYAITAIVNNIQISLNYQMSNPITWTAAWQSDWQSAGDELKIFTNGFYDYTKPPCETLLPSTACTLEIENIDEDAATVPNLRNICLADASITFATEVSTFANSCSTVAGGWQSGVVGTTNCTANATIHGSDYRSLRNAGLPGSNRRVRLYIEGGDIPEGSSCDQKAYWEFNKMFFGTYSGLNVDVTNNAPLQFQVAMEYNAFPDCSRGYIRYNPGKGVAAPIDFISMMPPNNNHGVPEA